MSATSSGPVPAPSAGAVPAVSPLPQVLVGLGTLAVAAWLAWGATSISADAGYAGVGPNFLPWVVSVLLGLCGVFMLREALTGGFRDLDEVDGAEQGDWRSFVWVAAGILLNASLITTIGFILSCALCYLLAVQGFRRSQGSASGGARGWITDALVGLAISAPVFWMFTKGLAISLPGLTQTGWI
ncbi:Tripartite tricarboxylate transporter TctB family [Sphaerotilus natans subsp. natans DSM 6575]|jgi:putative tricarboxylic transport membrane protein|uniref:Tripartite tricarboxylate transporter TctB family n=1 Tax=Sphaerotilus natans subsp. natans DSM 6575 TaxID=1286631 RepID=A0A059KGV6_9BURK|nr:tripartite tricarboxylate transporter TctB family protein [Sphaerotilus natans]KDB50580.1 Tripartite tricarboxylate transporter TctB family [Sphaerotilus natans subsp. natans DSM 6575]SIQ82778.1 putative tricarboxylic transport membrane protein [Sphaerotilus natans]